MTLIKFHLNMYFVLLLWLYYIVRLLLSSRLYRINEMKENGQILLSIYACTNRFVKGGIRFHNFPVPGRNKELCDKWIIATQTRHLQSLKIKKENRDSYRLCEQHFKPYNYTNPNDS